MNHTVLALIAASLYIGPGHVIAALPDYRAVIARDYVCDYYMLDCEGLPAPGVVFVDSVAMFGFMFYGMFSLASKDVIYLDWSVQGDPRRLMQALVHETAHYVDFNFIYRGATACEREALAFQVMNAWALDQGTPTDFDWHIRYECPAGLQVAL